jgi:RNA polymerase sigma factor (sigma-70 family)
MFVFRRLLELVAEQKLTNKGEMWGPYLRRAVHNKCIDMLRNEKRERERFPKGDPNDQLIIDWDPLGDAVASTLEQSRRLARLPDAVASLSDRHAAIIKHKFWALWPDNKIGETLCISGQAVGQQLRTALKKLNQEVNRDD